MESALASTFPPPVFNDTNQSASRPPPDTDVFYGTLSQKAVSILIFFIVAVGLVANSAVIYVVVRHRDMHTTTNFAFANLALTDILLLLFYALSKSLDSFGFSVSIYLNCWPTFYCRFVVGEVTGLTLAMMSYDRWRLVAYPLEAVKHPKRRKWVFLFTVFMLWVVSCVMCIPIVMYSVKITTTRVLCTLHFPWEHGIKAFYTYYSTCMYVVPLMLISICYLKMWLRLRKRTPGAATGPRSSQNAASQRTQRTLRLIVIVIVAFALAWLPQRVLILWLVWDPTFKAASPIYSISATITNLIIDLNSVINPFIYPFAGTGFRKHIGCLRKREGTVSSKTTQSQRGDAQSKMSTVVASSSVKNTNVTSLSVSCQTAPQMQHGSLCST